jgi:hypothetical protein
MHSSGDVRSMLALNSRANAMVALLVYPLLAFAFVFAVPLITLVYTAHYVEAVPVLRIYVFGLLMLVVEIQSVLFLMKQGAFAAWVNALVLVLAIPMSYFGAVTWGLPGAAIGSVVALYAERALSLSRLATPLTRRSSSSRMGDAPGILAAAAAFWRHRRARQLHAHMPPFAQLAGGAAIVAITYPAALFLMGQRQSLTSFIASMRHAARARGHQVTKETEMDKQQTWLVTGCAGFIGSNLLESLLSRGQKVVGLDNFSTGFQHNLDQVVAAVGRGTWKRFRFIEGDIRSLDTCREACKGVDYVLHEAALGSVPRSIDDPITSHESNVTGFLNMLVAARDAGEAFCLRRFERGVRGPSRAAESRGDDRTAAFALRRRHT